MSNFAVTGSNGFIGSHLVRYLRNQGHGVFCVIRDNLQNPTELTYLFEKFNPDYVIHLAAYGNHSTHKEPAWMLNANVIGTYNLLTSLKNVNFKGFVNIGSSSEYGIKHDPMNENDVPETDTFYGATKVAGTYLSRAFAMAYQKDIVTVRPFSVYGPGEADFRFIPTVCKALITQTPFPLSPHPMHDWIYIDDFISGIQTVLDNIHLLRGQIINIGTGNQYSNQEVVDLLEKISGKKIQYDVFGMADMRVYDSTSWVADNFKLRSHGWEQKNSIVDGLKKTYEYYEKQATKTEAP